MSCHHLQTHYSGAKYEDGKILHHYVRCVYCKTLFRLVEEKGTESEGDEEE